MKRLIMNVLAIFFPWIALLIRDNPLGAFLALVMQITIIGWIPASIWAWQAVHEDDKKQVRKKQDKTDNA